eukprot:m51a1_g2932 hypothetical protein (489) ;mRNA; r:580480-582294
METGKLGLILWCRAMAPLTSIVDFGDSWQDGTAFLALLRPFLSPADLEANLEALTAPSRAARHENLALAFKLAYKLGMRTGLTTEDMSDRRSVFTWIANLYHTVRPAKEGFLLSLRGNNPEWRRDPARLVWGHMSLVLGPKVLHPAQTAPRRAQTTDASARSHIPRNNNASQFEDNTERLHLSGARVGVVQVSELHKEVRSPELLRRGPDTSVVVVHAASGAPALLAADSNFETVSWCNAMSNTTVANVVRPQIGSEPPQLAGWLLKRGDRGPKGWKKRFFRLQGYSFMYREKEFGAEEPLDPDMTYSMKLCSGVQPLVAVHPLAFSVDFSLRSLVLRAESKESYDQWVSVLRASRDTFLKSLPLLESCKEKEGKIRVDNISIRDETFCAVAKQGMLLLSDKRNIDLKLKIPLYECDAELCDISSGEQRHVVRLVVGGRESRSSRFYYIAGESPDDTLDWLDVIVRQKHWMDACVSAIAWPRGDASSL